MKYFNLIICILLTLSFSSVAQIKKRYIFKDISTGLEYVQNKNLENGKIEYLVIYSFKNEYKGSNNLIVIIFKSQKELNEFSKDLNTAIKSMKPNLEEDLIWDRNKYSITLQKSLSSSDPLLTIADKVLLLNNFKLLSKGDVMKLISQIGRIDFGNPLLNPE